jgi:hypothetical protein
VKAWAAKAGVTTALVLAVAACSSGPNKNTTAACRTVYAILPSVDNPNFAVGATVAFPSQLSHSGDQALQAEGSVLASQPDRSTLVKAFAAMNAECLKIGIKPLSG